MMFLNVFPCVFLSIYGIYQILAACVFDSVVELGRATIKITPLDTRKARISTFAFGIFCLICAVFLALFFNAKEIGMYLHR